MKQNKHRRAPTFSSMPPRQQQGIVLVFTAISLILIFGMAGLAIDLGHAYANKTRMKNIIDATALSAARTLRETDSITEAETDARQTFTLAIGTGANQELANAGILAADVEFYYQSILSPLWSTWQTGAAWTAATAPTFVTAVHRNSTFPTWFMGVIGALGYQDLDQFRITVAATAAPIPIVNCNNFPVMACMVDNDTDCGYDKFGNDIGDSNGKCYGYDMFDQVCIKQGSGSDPECDSLLGGHFMLVDLPGYVGGNDLRQLLAGQPFACLGDTIDNKTGNTVGPTEQGMNTRFSWDNVANLDNTVYPPDHICCDPGSTPAGEPLVMPFTASTSPTFTTVFGATTPTMSGFTATQIQNSGFLQYKYINENAFTTNADGTRTQTAFNGFYDDPNNQLRDNRRTVIVPVADCATGDPGSSGSYDRVGFACMFLNRPAEGKGNTQFIFAEVHGDCNGKGDFTSQIETSAVDFVLYKSPYQ